MKELLFLDLLGFEQNFEEYEYQDCKEGIFKFLNDIVMKIGTLNKAFIQKDFNDIYCHEI